MVGDSDEARLFVGELFAVVVGRPIAVVLLPKDAAAEGLVVPISGLGLLFDVASDDVIEALASTDGEPDSSIALVLGARVFDTT